MIIHSAVLQASAPDLASCPPPDLPEFALIGRSNVGKSSLINMLTRRNGLARVSATPGKTRLINFFTINKKWNLVDLPGYGYAKVGRKQRAKFSSVIADFLKNRPSLHCTFVLLDSRLAPQEIDLAFLRWMVEAGLPVALVFTKADKLSQTATRKNIDAFLVSLREITQDEPLVLVSSSKDGKGRGEILGLVGRALAEGSGEFDS
jgi:GTP-binding protein